MKFTAMVLLALPGAALAKAAPTSTASASPNPAPTHDLSACKEEAGSYAEYCPRCEPRCDGKEGKDYHLCLNSTFQMINMIESQCWQHGGDNFTCKNKAVDDVCGASQ